MESISFIDGETLSLSQNLMWYAGMNDNDPIGQYYIALYL